MSDDYFSGSNKQHFIRRFHVFFVLFVYPEAVRDRRKTWPLVLE